jgi:hypothetical protein
MVYTRLGRHALLILCLFASTASPAGAQSRICAIFNSESKNVPREIAQFVGKLSEGGFVTTCALQNALSVSLYSQVTKDELGVCRFDEKDFVLESDSAVRAGSEVEYVHMLRVAGDCPKLNVQLYVPTRELSSRSFLQILKFVDDLSNAANVVESNSGLDSQAYSELVEATKASPPRLTISDIEAISAKDSYIGHQPGYQVFIEDSLTHGVFVLLVSVKNGTVRLLDVELRPH